ncbi:right-handed parallel beta-helix repeat-containing protein [Sphingomonas faeni]|uniref:right-handed parallel beta-helix repeat-containing protein n=1 Tax=Sphingomonas faeni TaxID=185950 RepID=UPI00335E580B
MTIEDVVLDMNGANNRISPRRAEHIFNRFPQAAIYVSGTPLVDGVRVAARMDDVQLRRLTIRNGPGVSCIVMAQSNTDGVTLGKRWKLENCLLQNTGNDTDDCSFIFAWADDVTASGCTFRNDIQVDDYGTGGLVGYEVHGSNHKFINNTVDNFMQGMWIGENRTDDVNNTLISGNTFKRIKAIGIATFGNDSAFVTYNHNIVDNTIIFDSLLHPGYPLKQGVSVTSLYPRRDVTVDGLRVISPPGNPVASTATAVNAPTMPGIHDQLTFRNVRAWGTTFRHYGRTNALRGIGTLTLDGGEGINLTPAGVFSVAANISMDASGAQIDHLIIDRPNAIDFRLPPQCGYASFLQGKFGRLTLKPGDRRGMTLGGHVESATTVASRGGSFEKTVPIAPPTIAAGASFTTTVAFPAVSFGDNVSVGFSASLGGLIAQMPTAGAGVVDQTFTNPTAATINLASLNATYITRKPA